MKSSTTLTWTGAPSAVGGTLCRWISSAIGFDILRLYGFQNTYLSILYNPRLLAYPRETVVSEKLEAMVKLGIASSRMKDFHDLQSLSAIIEFDGKVLVEAVQSTFEQRETDLPSEGVPLAFTPEFYEDENKIPP